jgi:hypothetical protein
VFARKEMNSRCQWPTRSRCGSDGSHRAPAETFNGGRDRRHLFRSVTHGELEMSMMLTARRILLVVLASLAIEGRAAAQVRTTAHIDTVFTFECSPEPISARFVGDLTFITTYHNDTS